MVNNLLIAISHDKYLTNLVFLVSNISYRTLLFFLLGFMTIFVLGP